MPLQNPSPSVISGPSAIMTPTFDFDATTITGLASGDNLATWTDALAAFTGTTVSAGTVKYFADGGPNNRPYVAVTSGAIRVPNVFTAPRHRNHSVYWVWKIATAGVSPLVAYDNGTAVSATFWVRDGTSSPQGYQASQIYQATNRTNANGWHGGYQSSDHDSTAYTIALGGSSFDWQLHKSANGGVAPSTVPAGYGLQIGYNAGSLQLARLVMFPRKLAWADHVEMGRYLASTYATYNPYDSAPGVVLCLGNSTTHNGPPYYLGRRVSDALGWPVMSLGYSGGTAATMTSQDAEVTALITRFRAAGKKVVIVWHDGHNDGWNNTSINNLKNRGPAYRALGAYLIACVPTPWFGNATKEADRVRYWEWLRGSLFADSVVAGDFNDTADFAGFVSHYGGTLDGPSYYDALCEGMAKDTRVAVWTSDANGPATYYSDGVHHNATGMDVLAEDQTADVLAAAAVAPGLIVAATPSAGSITDTGLTLSASAASGGKSPYTYQAIRNGSLVGSAGSSPSIALTGLTASTTYTLGMRVTDASGHWRDSATTSATTSGGGGGPGPDPDPGPTDSTLPVVYSAVLQPDGTRLTVFLSKDTTGTNGFAVTVGGSSRSSTATRVAPRVIDLTLATPGYVGQAVRLAYSGTAIVDGGANQLAAFSNMVVLNGSTIEDVGGGSPTSTAYYRPQGQSARVMVEHASGSGGLIVHDANVFGRPRPDYWVPVDVYQPGASTPAFTAAITGRDGPRLIVGSILSGADTTIAQGGRVRVADWTPRGADASAQLVDLTLRLKAIFGW